MKEKIDSNRLLFALKLPYEIVDLALRTSPGIIVTLSWKRFAPCPKTIETYFSNNKLCSNYSKGQKECSFDNNAGKKWGGQNNPAQCRKVLKKTYETNFIPPPFPRDM